MPDTINERVEEVSRQNCILRVHTSMVKMKQDDFQNMAVIGLGFKDNPDGIYGRLVVSGFVVRDDIKNPDVKYLYLDADKQYPVYFDGKKGASYMSGIDITEKNAAYRKFKREQFEAALNSDDVLSHSNDEYQIE